MAFNAFERKIDRKALWQYLTFGFSTGDRSLTENFNKLMPGHAGLLSLKNNDLTIWKYWELPKWDEKLYKDENVLSYELETYSENLSKDN